jgi:hypothetical protein
VSSGITAAIVARRNGGRQRQCVEHGPGAAISVGRANIAKISAATLNSRSELRRERFFLLRIIESERLQRRTAMRKLVLTMAAFAALGIAMPSAALADTVIIHKHRHRIYNEVVPPPFHHHHDSKTVIIKHNND